MDFSTTAQRLLRPLVMKLRPFQREFVAGVLQPGITRACLSVPRGNGKSFLAGCLAADSLTPGGALFEAGAENVLLSGSFDQARYVYRFAKGFLGEAGYSYLDSTNKLAIRHKATGTRLLVRSSRARGAFGIVGARIAIADEPGTFDTIGGELMNDALDTAIGKPGTDLKVVYIGTVAPSRPGGWWADLISDGSGGSTYVLKLQGDLKRWDRWPEIRRCNPLTAISSSFRKTLLEERDQARRDPRLKARFCSYRLNRPSQDESSTLLTVDDWQQVLKRPVPERVGKPICAVDLGGSRAWSAALVIYPSGRIECLAVAPGIPSISDQEQRDRVPANTYQRLKDQGTLHVADGLRVPKPSQLVELITQKWGNPASIVCDRFRVDELRDVGLPCRLEPRVSRWSEAAFDIRSLRKASVDGPFAVAECSRSLLEASLSVASVKSDDQGSVRLVKRTRNNESRDDIAMALCLAAGAWARAGSAQGVTISRTPF